MEIKKKLVQLAGAVEYTDYISTESKTPPMIVLDTKQSDGEVSGMWSTPSLLLFPGPLWPGVVAPDRVLSMDQIELFDILNSVQAKLNC